MKTVRVPIGDRSYPVHVGSGLIGAAADLVQPPEGAEAIALVCDQAVDRIYGEAVESSFAMTIPVLKFTVPGGEESKSLDEARHLLEELADRRIRRTDLLVTLGGGMIGDLGGFIASVYQRGMALAHLPTTLLAQVDASIGGKTGVNLSSGKNLAGTYWHPRAVVCDVDCLATLPEREFRSGMAEVAKYGFILDPPLLEVIEADADAIAGRNPEILEEIVARCAALKARVVAADERDQELRLVLNYGHTLGHALEAAGDYRRWSHGEAVAVGMVFAAALAQKIGFLDESVVGRHEVVLGRLGLPTRAEFDPDQLARIWSIDKKYRGGQRWVLLKSLGEAVVESGVDERAVAAAVKRVREQ